MFMSNLNKIEILIRFKWDYFYKKLILRKFNLPYLTYQYVTFVVNFFARNLWNDPYVHFFLQTANDI